MKTARRPACRLQLSNGASFAGELIGSPRLASGQMVFTTGLVGYEQALTDPSFHGQILMFTYPLIGNYGIPAQNGSKELPIALESARVQAAAVIVSEVSPDAYHWTKSKTLDEWLIENKVPGISGIDTRDLVHVLRSNPNLLGKVVPDGEDAAAIDFYDPGALNVLPKVSCMAPQIVGKGKTRIAIIDCGVKWNIVRLFAAQGCEVHVLPWTVDPATVDCDAWVISNGPGDPKLTGDLTARIQGIMKEKTPTLGICLGNQLLALAAGGVTKKMNYGHRSHNQPVIDRKTGRGFITSQNHGYVVVIESLPEGWEPWFINANDRTIEGIYHRELPFSAVQFHPEACGGPRDTGWIIEDFVAGVRKEAICR